MAVLADTKHHVVIGEESLCRNAKKNSDLSAKLQGFEKGWLFQEIQNILSLILSNLRYETEFFGVLHGGISSV